MRIIEFLSDAEKYEFWLEQVDLFKNDWAVATITTLANQIMIDEIQDRMRAARYHKKIIDRTFLGGVEIKSGRAFVHIISDYESESGFAVADAHEFGTRDHMIEPKNVTALAFIVNGVLMFSKGHRVSGIKSHRIIRTTIAEKADVLESRYRDAEEKFLQENLYDKLPKKREIVI